MLTYEQAIERILKATPAPRAVRVTLDEALGLVLARPIVARCDLPLFDHAAVDGYAVRCADGIADAAGVTLRVVGCASAGTPSQRRLRAGQAARILTGAVIPRGADGVVMQEHVQRSGDQVIVNRWPQPGQHIRRRGEDLRRGAQALEAGRRLRAQELGLLASLGARAVPVYPRPTVAVLVTGDELKSQGGRLRAGQIYDSNGPLLTALAQQAGARVVRLGRARDLLSAVSARLTQGLTADLLLVCGGVSVGDKDVVRQAAKACGVKELFWKVDIKPGMPLFFGKRGRTLVFGLPGNPVSVFVTFEEFVKPALFRLMKRAWQDGYTQQATLASGVQVSTTRRTHFIRVRNVGRNGRLLVEPVHGQGSHQLRTLVEADGWIRMAAGQRPWPAGTPVVVKREEHDR
ncbi:MAG: molybdopterin molybdotransferase MoeA [Candidatus Omnitrophota bacterium]|nr:molybdopterin molybdotransferase MoeA [Candidatus Omnitrophota bacterium]